jgi:hypothetical protein
MPKHLAFLAQGDAAIKLMCKSYNHVSLIENIEQFFSLLVWVQGKQMATSRRLVCLIMIGGSLKFTTPSRMS